MVTTEDTQLRSGRGVQEHSQGPRMRKRGMDPAGTFGRTSRSLWKCLEYCIHFFCNCCQSKLKLLLRREQTHTLNNKTKKISDSLVHCSAAEHPQNIAENMNMQDELHTATERSEMFRDY